MKIKNIIENMTLEEKIGQLCVPILQQGEITQDLKEYVEKYKVGMIRYCPNAEFDNASEVVGEPNKYFSAGEMALFLNSIQKMSKIPLFFAIDQEGSTRNDMNRAKSFAYSGHMSFGAVDDTDLTYEIAKAAGKEFRSMGINLVQAPIVDVLTYDGRKTMKAATFGENVEKVTAHALAMMKGYKDGGVATMAKHFPGYGSVATDAHKGVAEITKDFESFDSEDIAPMKELFKHGLNGVMTGHAITHCLDSEHPATLSKKVIGDYLRDKLGFDGIVETDAMRMSAIQTNYGTGEASVMAVEAGCDLVLLRGNMDHFKDGYNALCEAVKSGRITEERINKSIERVLKQKDDIGLLENYICDPKVADETVGCEAHRNLSKELAKRSITTLKGENLPLDTCKKVLTVSVEPQKIKAANDDFQCVEMLCKAVSNTYKDSDYIMTKLNPSEDEIKEVASKVKGYDTVVIGICNAIIYEKQIDLVNAIYNENKNIVLVAMDSPYDVELFPYAKDFICTYGVSADSMYAAVDVISGKAKGDAKPPVTINL
ncbi:MAG: hypothetical protein E7391_02165 [Ruminococcaceae bacterium]|nr:hypothetical protein [Oscillospiraceae bacterium]